jgi:mannose-6-phosphate isomerase
VPAATHHRIENPGLLPLVIIEIANGEYLGEDDIVRFEDDYHRAPRAGNAGNADRRPRRKAPR